MTDHSSMLSHADRVAHNSNDPSTKVGAVLYSSRGYVCLGYNHIASSIPYQIENLHDRSWKYPRVIHAEMDCLLHVQPRLHDKLKMAVTHFPCERCAAHIIDAGIKTVITRKPSEDFLVRWPGISISLEMFMEAKIKLIYPES